MAASGSGCNMDAPRMLWLLIFTSGFACLARSQDPLGLSAPITLRVERNWYVSPGDPLEHVVARVQREYSGGPPLVFGLETSGPPVPFRIDPNAGVVYVNDTLTDKANRTYSLWVTASNGDVPNKLEVLASVTDSHGFRQRVPRPPFPLPYPISKVTKYPFATARPTKATTEKVDETTAAAASFDPITTSTLGPPRRPEDLDLDHNATRAPPPVDNKISDTKEKNETGLVVSENDLNVTVIPLVAIAALVAVVAIVIVLVWRRNIGKKSKSKKEDMSKEPNGGIVLQDASLHGWNGPRAFSNRYEPWDNNHLQMTEGEGGDGGAEEDVKEPPRDEWEFPRHRLRVFNIVGEGAFGQVWRAQATDIDGRKGEVTVAVKTLKENASEKERCDLLQELQVMKGLGTHPNVVRLLACCTDKEPTFVIMEFVSLGKLQSFLRDSRAERHYGNTHGGSRSLTSRDLTHFAYQVARGMHFLSSKGIIHRDLAARNVLITEERTCKVADFGFARDVAGTHVYERKSDGRLPIRWMAPESLYDDIFSVKSDIWSFGVLVWEIVTLGSTPYPGLSAGDVMRKVRDGHRLEKPEHCRRELYNIMYYCWEAEQSARPDFAECVSLLERLLCTETDYIELERFPDHSYYNVQHLEGEKL